MARRKRFSIRGQQKTAREPEPADPALLRQYLANRDAPCPNCGYNLRNLTGEACPECGETLYLGLGQCPRCRRSLLVSLGLKEARPRAFLAGLIGLATSAGYSGLLLLHYMSIYVVFGQETYPTDAYLISAAFSFVASTGLLLLWLANRPLLDGRPVVHQTGLAVLCWLVPIVNMMVGVTILTMA